MGIEELKLIVSAVSGIAGQAQVLVGVYFGVRIIFWLLLFAFLVFLVLQTSRVVLAMVARPTTTQSRRNDVLYALKMLWLFDHLPHEKYQEIRVILGEKPDEY
jgi:uncharacterized membrane protein